MSEELQFASKMFCHCSLAPQKWNVIFKYRRFGSHCRWWKIISEAILATVTRDLATAIYHCFGRVLNFLLEIKLVVVVCPSVRQFDHSKREADVEQSECQQNCHVDLRLRNDSDLCFFNHSWQSTWPKAQLRQSTQFDTD